jgi:HK97 family phage major capsid protein
VSAEWTAEGTEAADATPTVGQLQITPQKADAYLFGSFEVLSDSDFGQQLPELLADAKDRIEETAFAVGTGTGQPLGVITAGTVVPLASGTAATGPTAASVYTLMGSLPARWRSPRANNVWIMNLATINILRNVPSFTGSFSSIVNDNGGTPTLLGKPILESTSVLGVQANGNKVIAFLDARQFYIVDRIGMSVVYDPIVLGTNRRPTGQGAWYAFWRVGSGVSTASAIRVGSDTT